MIIKELAYSTQQLIQTSTGCGFKRTHFYELLAASFGYKSFAAFNRDMLWCNHIPRAPLAELTPELVGRAVQLGYPQSNTEAIALCVVDQARANNVSSIGLSELMEIMRPDPLLDYEDDWGSDLEDDEGDDDDFEFPSKISILKQKNRLLTSKLLKESLEQSAVGGNPLAHFAIAEMYRCARPNSYLSEEARKGRMLNSVEQGWVDGYENSLEQFKKSRSHMRQAALGGIYDAAHEYIALFSEEHASEMAAVGESAVEAQTISYHAEPQREMETLRVAAKSGSFKAVKSLAGKGDLWAIEKLAETGDIDAIWDLAQMEMQSDLVKAWSWVYVAKMLGTDFTESNMRAYHEGGLYDGQEYDDDCGGPLYVDGDEGMDLTPLEPKQDQVAQELALAFFEKIHLPTLEFQ